MAVITGGEEDGDLKRGGRWQPQDGRRFRLQEKGMTVTRGRKKDID
jgi:hypothetical protein